jgi:pectate lyase
MITGTFVTRVKRLIKVGPIFLFAILFTDIAGQSSVSIPAFPGAAGHGANTPGGRGGRVIRVSNLNDSGEGSFRAALQEKPAYPNEPRIIIFDVCGTIEAEYGSTINVIYPFVTIAGQTAPGDGITLKGAELSVGTHDVIIRGMRFRPGNEGYPRNCNGPDGIKVSNYLGLGDIYNVIIDHCSVSFGLDENVSTWQNTNTDGQISNVTFQWNIISEGLEECSSMGMLIGDRCKNISIHSNLFAHNSLRNPLIQSDTRTEFINNVIYNWKDGSTSVMNSNRVDVPSFADIIGNYYILGPDYKHHEKPDPAWMSFWEIDVGTVGRPLHPGSRVFIKGNRGPNRPDDSFNEWSLVKGDRTHFKAGDRVAATTTYPVIIETAENAFQNVLNFAGATVPRRDATDVRVIESVNNLSGSILREFNDIGGYPVYLSNCEPPLDSDGDGIPDWFEDAYALNRYVPDGNSTELSDSFTGVEGYTNIEVYLNYLIDRAKIVIPQ